MKGKNNSTKGERPRRETHVPVAVQRIEWQVAKHFGVTIEEMRSQSKVREYADARFVAWYLSMQLIDRMTYSQLGRIYNKDHTTVINGVQKVGKTALEAEAQVVLNTIRKATKETWRTLQSTYPQA